MDIRSSAWNRLQTANHWPHTRCPLIASSYWGLSPLPQHYPPCKSYGDVVHEDYYFRNEKEGIPANLIHLLDQCVEIPQQGVVRSLNVHVSGALLVWEYRRQRLLGNLSN